MRVKGGGGKRKSWEAMPLDDGGLLFDDTDPNDVAFAVPEHQPSVTEPEGQIEPESEHQEENQEERNDGDGEGEDGDGEEGEEGEGEAEAEEEDENKERSTKLDEGFYEIEAIRRKRVRKGQLQYLIKWRGWPETANTWEPLENLQSVSDVVDAFEESLHTGKQRKRKRKSGTPHTQPKKKQQQQRSTDTSYIVTDGEISNADKALSSGLNGSGVDGFPPPQQFFHTVGVGENNGRVEKNETANINDPENFCANVSLQFSERREENEYDPKLSELKATVSPNNVGSDKLSVHFQEPKAPEVNGPTNGLSKVDCGEPVQGGRSTGAKRRKSGSVKRFKQEAHGSTQNAPTRVSMRYAGRVDQIGVENLDYAGENSGRKNKIDECKEAVRITKILKPMGYSTSISNNVQDVSVTFMAMRSDGSEVIVDNKFLKVNDPLLLINFYEQHLRYSPAV